MGPHRDGMEMRSRAQRASARARGARGGCPRGHFGAPLRSVHRFKHRGNARQLRAGISARISAHPGGAGWRLGAPHRAAERWSKPPTHPSVSLHLSQRAEGDRASALGRRPAPRSPLPARAARPRAARARPAAMPISGLLSALAKHSYIPGRLAKVSTEQRSVLLVDGPALAHRLWRDSGAPPDYKEVRPRAVPSAVGVAPRRLRRPPTTLIRGAGPSVPAGSALARSPAWRAAVRSLVASSRPRRVLT